MRHGHMGYEIVYPPIDAIPWMFLAKQSTNTITKHHTSQIHELVQPYCNVTMISATVRSVVITKNVVYATSTQCGKTVVIGDDGLEVGKVKGT